MSRRRRLRDEQQPDRWVVSYADFITLLLAFFVVMYSISSVNEGKYKALSESLEGVFRGVNSSLEAASNPQLSAEQGSTGRQDPAPEFNTETAVDPATLQLRQIEAVARNEFQALMEDGDLSISGSELWLEIEIQSSLLFASGSAEPSLDADDVLEALAAILKRYQNPIHVEGFTDNRPIQSALYPSNWELSVARAAGVVRMLSHFGVAPQRMAAVGYGEYQPKVSNVTARGRSKNRRVKIIVSRDARVQRTLTGYGSDFVGDTTVEAMLEPQGAAEAGGTVTELETEQGVIFTRGSE